MTPGGGVKWASHSPAGSLKPGLPRPLVDKQNHCPFGGTSTLLCPQDLQVLHPQTHGQEYTKWHHYHENGPYQNHRPTIHVVSEGPAGHSSGNIWCVIICNSGLESKSLGTCSGVQKAGHWSPWDFPCLTCKHILSQTLFSSGWFLFLSFSCPPLTTQSPKHLPGPPYLKAWFEFSSFILLSSLTRDWTLEARLWQWKPEN